MRAVDPEGGGIARPEIRRYGDVKKGYTAFLPGDAIMAKITPCMENGKITVVPNGLGDVFFGSTEFHVIRPEQEIRSTWIAQFLLQHAVRQAAQRAMSGAVGQMRVPSTFLHELPIPIAPASEQAFVSDLLDELLSDLDAGARALEGAQAKLNHYRASILKAAFTGQLALHDASNESASQLLARISIERDQYTAMLVSRKRNTKKVAPALVTRRARAKR
jgi:type I restriction enzyme S subunit